MSGMFVCVFELILQISIGSSVRGRMNVWRQDKRFVYLLFALTKINRTTKEQGVKQTDQRSNIRTIFFCHTKTDLHIIHNLLTEFESWWLCVFVCFCLLKHLSSQHLSLLWANFVSNVEKRSEKEEKNPATTKT